MKTDEKRAQQALAPLTKFAEKNPGTITAVTNRLSQKQGSKVHRQQVESWLHSDPAKRIQPRFGMGLLLVEAGKEVVAEMEQEAAEKIQNESAKS